MHFTLENKVTAGFSVALLLTLIISAISWRSNDQQSREADWAQHTQEVLTRLEALLSSITDGETGQLGFIITGDEVYLEPYQTYRVKADREYQALLRLTADHPLQHARLTNLQPLLEARASEITKNIELRRQGFEVAAQAIRSGRGKALHDQIRYRIGEIEATERDLLMHREIDAEASAKLSRLLIVLRSLLAVGVIAVALVIIHRDIAGRNQVKQALVNANAQLQVATKQAQHADRIKSAFLATMSHELRTSLNSIIGFSGILLQELAGPLNTEQKNSGLTLAQKQPVDLVLLDIQLPGMDGYAVARALRANPITRDLSIVAVTSYAMAGDREAILAAGCDGYLEKLIDPETFVADIAGFLQQKSSRGAP